MLMQEYLRGSILDPLLFLILSHCFFLHEKPNLLKKELCFNLSRQFVSFKPLSYCFEETTGFDVKASFTSRPLLRLIR